MNDTTAEVAVKKSIVPAKYSGKYKGGGSDPVAVFINEQSKGKDGFEFPAFFALARKNGIDDTKVSHYEGIVAAKEHGAEGRARMTIGNMLRAKARKESKLIGLNDAETAFDLPKPAVSGAAAAAQASAETAAPADAGEAATETVADETVAASAAEATE
jgi:hypothetical protein